MTPEYRRRGTRAATRATENQVAESGWVKTSISFAPWVVLAFLLSYLIAGPIGYMILESLNGDNGLTLGTYAEVLADQRTLRSGLNSILVGLGVAGLGVLVGVPLAFGVARTQMRGKKLVSAAVIIAIISPDYLVAMAYVILMGPNVGWLNQFLRETLDLTTTYGPLNIFSLWGFVFVALPTGVAFVYLQVLPTFYNMDPSLEEAARLGGATSLRTVLKVTLPLMRPAILSGAILAFVVAIGMYGAPYMLGIDVLTVAIRDALLVGLDLSTVAVLAVSVSVLSLAALFLYRWSVRNQDRYITVGGKSFRPGTIDIGWASHVFTALGVLWAIVGFIFPYLSLLVASLLPNIGTGFQPALFTLSNYVRVIGDELTRSALINSLALSVAAASVVAMIGFLTGYMVVRRRSALSRYVDYVSIVPMGIAGTALAAGLIIAYLSPPLATLGLYGSVWLLFIGYLTRFTGFGVRNCQAAIMQLSPELEESARVGGASEFTTLRRVTLPLALNAVAFAWILVFIRAFPEMSASVMLRGIGMEVVSTALLDLWNGSGGLPVAAALGVLVFSGVTFLVLAAQALLGKKVVDMSSG